MAGVLVLAMGVGIGIGAWIAPTSPAVTAQGLLSKAVAAATHAGSFHYVEQSTVNGSPDDITGDAARNGGRQVITQRCASGIDVFDLRLVKGTVYFRGNLPAVIDQLGVPGSSAHDDVDRWVMVAKGQMTTEDEKRLYKAFAAGIATKSNLSQLPSTFTALSSAPVPSSSPAETRIAGGFPRKGHAPVGTVDLVITTGSSLPRSLSGDAVGTGGRLTLSWTWTHFGEKVPVSAPAGATPYPSLGATPPASACS